MAQNLIGNPTETDTVIDLVKQKLRAVDQHRLHVVHNTCSLFELLAASVIEIELLLPVMGAKPQLSLLEQHVRFFSGFCHAKLLHFRKSALSLAHHHNTYCARAVGLFSYKHGAKIRKNLFASPCVTEKFS